MYTMPNTDMTHEYSGVARNLIWGWVYVLTSHCNFKTCVNIPHVNKTVTNFVWHIYRYTPCRCAPDRRFKSMKLLSLRVVSETKCALSVVQMNEPVGLPRVNDFWVGDAM